MRESTDETEQSTNLGPTQETVLVPKVSWEHLFRGNTKLLQIIG